MQEVKTMQSMITKETMLEEVPKKALLPKDSMVFTKVLLHPDELSERLGGMWDGPIRDKENMWYGYTRIK